jgi:hypothetical protein
MDKELPGEEIETFDAVSSIMPVSIIGTIRRYRT